MTSIRTAIRDIVPAHIRAQVEEHRRRYESDPDYRAECDAEKAASDEAWQAHLDAERAPAAVLAMKQRLESSGIPEHEQDYLESHFETDAIKVALDFAARADKTILILGGSRGVGKTIACCVAAWRQPGSVRFVTGMDLVRNGTYNPDFWTDLIGTHSLVIDELGAEPLDEKGWALANILDLLFRRYRAKRKTWITLNLPIEAFFARYGTDGERLRDKLRECGRYVEVKGKSLRR